MEASKQVAHPESLKHTSSIIAATQHSHMILNKSYVSTLISNVVSVNPLSIAPSEWPGILSHSIEDELQSDTKFNSVRNSLLKGIPSKLY